ncbi:MAG TPA: FAD-linked oxidase C-terminal domain-containing protein [Gammaproteobacteria bacterium]|nr:FAD-linked oxidase C-terminal domain-containing protein [Gammaproteobacteria bacterium]
MTGSKLSADFLDRLGTVVGKDDLYTDPADRWPYSYDNSRRQSQPDAVAFPASHAEVVQVVRLCNEFKVPLTTRGLGSSTTGSAVPLKAGLVLALERMNKILSVDGANRALSTEAGVTNAAVQEAAAKQGFFWPPDPTSAGYSTVGGNLACGAGGPHAVKYGTARENVLGLRAVLGSGQELTAGVYTTKGAMGYDFTRLLVGSEGTLAVITEATLKLTPKPEGVRTLRALYADMTAAAAAVSRIMAQPVTPCVLEFIDGAAVGMIRGYAGNDLPADAGAMLIIEVDGAPSQLDDAAAAVAAAAQGLGCMECGAAKDDKEAQALWTSRKALSPALRKIAPKKINEDVVVPVSRMAEFISHLDGLSKRYGVPIVNFGHAGNGNIHVNLLVDPDDHAQMKNAEPCLQEVFRKVLDMRGTLSGEHGVGIEKRRFMALEFDPPTLDLMRRIKRDFDPNGILNPEKLLPA